MCAPPPQVASWLQPTCLRGVPWHVWSFFRRESQPLACLLSQRRLLFVCNVAYNALMQIGQAMAARMVSGIAMLSSQSARRREMMQRPSQRTQRRGARCYLRPRDAKTVRPQKEQVCSSTRVKPSRPRGGRLNNSNAIVCGQNHPDRAGCGKARCDRFFHRVPGSPHQTPRAQSSR